MPKTAVITQSNYIPWRGYFDLLGRADEVILLDSVQYTRRDWRNRNQIKSPNGKSWLTIPVQVKGNYEQSIDEVQIADVNWAHRHRRAIQSAYARAAHFDAVGSWFFNLLDGIASEALLTKINEVIIRETCKALNIDVKIRRCSDVIHRDRLTAMQPTERLVSIAAAVGAERYLSGPSAREYLQGEQFCAAGIEVVWMSYEGYSEYPQLWGAFDGHVSIIDLLLNVGFADARNFLRDTK